MFVVLTKVLRLRLDLKIMVQWEAWCCVPARWRDNNQSEERLSSGRQWPGLMAETPEWHSVTWSPALVTNKHCHCHSTHYLSYTSQHSKHIVTSDQTQIITQQTQKVSQLVLSELVLLLLECIKTCLKAYLALSKLYVSLTAGGCSILPVTIWWEMRCVRLWDTHNLWLCWPASPGHWHWLSLRICGLWPSDDNTRMWDTKNWIHVSLVSIFCFLCQGDVPMVRIWVRHSAC